MKNEGGREAGKCSKVVPDRGDRCLFIFLCSRLLFCNVFPYPVCKAQIIGDWYENKGGAPNTSIFLIFRHSYWRTDAPCANRGGGPNKKKKLLAQCAWSSLPIGGGGHRCANILAHRSTGPQSRQSARLSLQSSELGPQPLNPQVSVSPPLVPGGDTLACRRGGGWGPNIGEQTKKI